MYLFKGGLTLIIKHIITCFAIVTILTISSIPAAAPSSEQLIEQRIIIRHWEIVTIREGPDLIYIKCEPLIDSVEQLQAYKTARLDLLHNISNTMNPEDKVGAVVTFNYYLAFSEMVTLATMYEFNFTYYEYIGNYGNQGGISVLTGESLEDREELLKQHLGPDFKIIGITMTSGSIPVKQLLDFQNEPVVFLVDIGPPEIIIERSKGKPIGSAIPNLYFALTKSLPLSTSLPPTTTLYTTFLVSPTTIPSTPLTTPLTTPIVDANTSQPEVIVEELQSGGFLVIIALMVTLILLLLPQPRIRRHLRK